MLSRISKGSGEERRQNKVRKCNPGSRAESIGRAVGTGEMPKGKKEENLVTGWPRGKKMGKVSEFVP